MIRFYFIILSILGIISLGTKKKDWFTLIWCVLLFVLISLRHESCFLDTPRYVNNYRFLPSIEWKDIPFFFTKDPFFWFFSKFINVLSNGSYTVWFSIMGGLYCFSIYRFVKSFSKEPYISFLLFFVLGFFVFSTTGLRQNMAFSFVLLSFPYLLRRKYTYFVLFVIIATLFHISALVCLLFVPIRLYRISYKLISIYSALIIATSVYGSLIMKYAIQSLEDERFEQYSEETSTLNYSGLIILIGLVVSSIIIVRKKTNEQYYSLYLHLAFGAILFQSLAAIVAESFRASMYFKYYLLLLFPNSLYYIKNKYDKFFALLVVIIAFSLYVIYSPNSGLADDYRFFWE